MCRFYTGFVHAQIVMLLNFIYLSYWGAKECSASAPEISPSQQLILTLIRSRKGLLVRDLAFRFKISSDLVSNIFTTWIQLMFQKFHSVRPLMFPSRKKIAEILPKSFSKLKNIRVIIDCAEFICETPSNLEHQKKL